MRALSQKCTPVSGPCVGFLQQGETGVSLPVEKPPGEICAPSPTLCSVADRGLCRGVTGIGEHTPPRYLVVMTVDSFLRDTILLLILILEARGNCVVFLLACLLWRDLVHALLSNPERGF